MFAKTKSLFVDQPFLAVCKTLWSFTPAFVDPGGLCGCGCLKPVYSPDFPHPGGVAFVSSITCQQNHFDMKKIIASLLVGSSLLFSLSIQAQDELPARSNWVSSKGYWVVETNKHKPKEAIVCFYNNDNLLVYKKEVKDQKLNLKKEATLLQLKATLEDAIAAYENGVAANKGKQAVRLINR